MWLNLDWKYPTEIKLFVGMEGAPDFLMVFLKAQGESKSTKLLLIVPVN